MFFKFLNAQELFKNIFTKIKNSSSKNQLEIKMNFIKFYTIKYKLQANQNYYCSKQTQRAIKTNCQKNDLSDTIPWVSHVMH